jgi:hypothetical protein
LKTAVPSTQLTRLPISSSSSSNAAAALHMSFDQNPDTRTSLFNFALPPIR